MDNKEVILAYLKDERIHSTKEIAGALSLLEGEVYMVSSLLFELRDERKVELVSSPTRPSQRPGGRKWQLTKK